MNDAQLKWQCRRGMRELDELLLDYLENTYPEAGEDQKQAFRALLMLPDPELIAYLLGGEAAEDHLIAGVVGHIRNRTQD